MVLLLIPQKSRLNKSQLAAIVDIFVGSGLVCFGSVIVPGLVDKISQITVLYALAGMTIFWTAAVVTARKANE